MESFRSKRHHRDLQFEVKTKLQRKRLKDVSRKLTEYWHIYLRQYVILLNVLRFQSLQDIKTCF